MIGRKREVKSVDEEVLEKGKVEKYIGSRAPLLLTNNYREEGIGICFPESREGHEKEAYPSVL